MQRLIVLICIFMGCTGCPKENNATIVNSGTNNEEPPSGADGSPCASDSQCDGETCLTPDQGWNSGYCTTLDCQPGECNGEDSACVSFLDDSSLCFDVCESNTQCRSGYRCRTLDASGRRVCYRDFGDGPPAGAIGAECGAPDDCHEGLTCDDSLPGGYCIQSDCSGTCPEGATCTEWEGTLRCMQSCGSTRDCRVGYVCDLMGDSICIPSEQVEPPFDFSVTEDVLGVRCDAEELPGSEEERRLWEIEFEVPDDAASYTFVPFVRTGSLRPLTLRTPDRELDLIEEYRHHNIRSTEFQLYDQESEGTFGEVAFDWPITIPYAPQHADLVVGGTHTLEVATTTAPPCVYVVPSTGAGVALDLNVYFVGLEGFSADTAPSDPDLNAVFDRVDEILGQAGVRLGDIQFLDAPREVSERYGFVRSLAELKRTVAFGAPRDESLRGHLNVDVFLVNDLQFNGALVFGLSAGLPGPPGLHGNPANGLVFSGADIGSDNAFAAHVMAHELGHYLGLRHTTEIVFGSDTETEAELDRLMGATDPIEDTQVCEDIFRNPANCPDRTNLMFPAAPMETFDPELTDGQSAALRACPLLLAGGAE